MTAPRCAFAVLAMLAAQAAHGRDVSAEVGATTVWFALLVVVFALLVSVGLFVARDQNERSNQDAKPDAVPRRTGDLQSTRRRTARARHKQQEFT